jgi:hypothetical protein
MVRPATAVFAAGILLAASVLASRASAESGYRTAHADWGNDAVSKDRIYARDPVSGKHVVLSRRWGSICGKRAALNYRFGGGCWYPIRAGYLGWRKRAEGWVRLRP